MRTGPIGGLSLSALLAIGCATTRRDPPLPLPARFVSPTPFLAHVRARADTAATNCQVLRIEGKVAMVRGDTLEFSELHAERQPNGAADCLAGRPAYVVVSSAPDLQAETSRANSAMTISLFVFIVPFTALVTLIALLGS